jgi:hypothetical protein
VATGVEVSVNIVAVLVLILELVISNSVVYVDGVNDVDVSLDIISDDWIEVNVLFILLVVSETSWVMFVLELLVISEFDVACVDKEEAVVIDACVVFPAIDAVDNKVELTKNVELISVDGDDVSSLLFAAKIKEKRFVNIVISHHIHYDC